MSQLMLKSLILKNGNFRLIVPVFMLVYSNYLFQKYVQGILILNNSLLKDVFYLLIEERNLYT